MGPNLKPRCLIYKEGIEIHCNEGRFYVEDPIKINPLNLADKKWGTKKPIVELLFNNSKWHVHFKRFLSDQLQWKGRFNDAFLKLSDNKGFWLWLGFVDYLHRQRLESLEGIAILGLSRYAREFPTSNKLSAACFLRQSKRLLEIDIKSSLESNDKAMNLYKSIDSTKGTILSHIQYAKIYLQMNRLEEAFQSVKEAINQLKTNDENHIKADAHVVYGRIYLQNKTADKALNQFREALELLRDAKDKLGIARCLNNIGVAEDILNHVEEATVAYNESYQLFEELSNAIGSIKTLINLGLLHERNEDYEKSISIYLKALSKSETENAFDLVCISVQNLSILYRKFENWKSSYDINLHLITVHGAKLSVTQIGKTELKLGTIAIRLKKLNQAKSHLIKSIESFEKIGDNQGLDISLESLATLLEQMNLSEESMSYRQIQLNRFTERSDTLGVAKTHFAIGIMQRQNLSFNEAAMSFQKAIGCYLKVECNDGMLSALFQMGKTMHILGDLPSFLVCVKGVDVALKESPDPETHYYFQQLELLYGLRNKQNTIEQIHHLCVGVQMASELLLNQPDAQHDASFSFIEAIHWFSSKKATSNVLHWLAEVEKMILSEWHPMYKTLLRLKKKYRV